MSIKPKPAPIPTPKGYRLHFCHGKQYRHGIIKDEQTANILQSKVNNLKALTTSIFNTT